MPWSGDKTDLPTLWHLLALAAIGVVAVASATHDGATYWSGLATRQVVWVALGVAVYWIVQRTDYHAWADVWFLIYLAGLAVLLLVLVTARPIAGARSWLELGPLRLQPSEPIKPVVALAVAAFMSDHPGRLDLGRLVRLGLLVGAPMILIALQPDHGTMLTLVPLFLAAAWLAGIRPRLLLSLALVAALSAPVVWIGVLEDYQKERILTVFDPSRDPSGSGYQVIQSRIAVGSGGATGQGLFGGSQSRLDFLPARETDFVVAVIAEETGFLGVLTLLGLYLSLLWRALATARLSQDPLGTYLAAGIASIWAVQALVNIGMVTGMLPTIGVPLPLVSYGGSSVVATFFAFGLVSSVRARRFVNV